MSARVWFLPLEPARLGRRLAIRLSDDQSPTTDVWYDVSLVSPESGEWRRLGNWERMPLMFLPVEAGRIAIAQEDRRIVQILYAGHVYGRTYRDTLDWYAQRARERPKLVSDEEISALEHLTQERLGTR